MRGVSWLIGRGRWLRWVAWGAAVVTAVVLTTFFMTRLYFRGRIFPGITIAGAPVGSLTLSRASSSIQQRSLAFSSHPLLLSFNDRAWEVPADQIHLQYHVSETVKGAYSFGRDGAFFGALHMLAAFVDGVDLPIRYSLDETALEASLSAVASAVDVPSVPPSLQVLDAVDPKTQSRIVVNSGEMGRRVDLSLLRRSLHQRFQTFSSIPVPVPVLPLYPPGTSIDARLTAMRAERLLDKRLTLSYADGAEASLRSWELSGKDLVGFLSFDGGFDSVQIASYSATLAASIDRPYQNATFVFRNERVVEFAPERDGLALDTQEAVAALVRAFSELETGDQEAAALDLPVARTPPAITTADANDLGIRELLGRGVSTFHGSIANREHNIAISSNRIAGVLVPPGETFSFNASVGDISAVTGYRQSYIIKDGRTVLDDGGGVCQTSTTLFRAVLDAGLPIVQRRAHSYRVGYYEQNSKPGFDATVFAPSVDFKFLNDTPAHLLVQATADTATNRLVLEIYGTSDGRVASITNHRTWDVTPPPPDLYQDDPTLPAGVVKQVDWKAWGAKVKFDYAVERDGETIFEKTYYSNFRPWQSVFLRGTGGA